jgi:hypothetical protein
VRLLSLPRIVESGTEFRIFRRERDLVLFHNRGVLHTVVGAFTPDQVRVFHQCNLAASDEPAGPSEEDVKQWTWGVLRSRSMLVCTTMYCVDNLGWVGLMKAWCNELEWQTYIHNFTTHHSSFSNSTSCQSNCCIPPKFRRSFDFGREVKGVHLRNCTREGIQTIEDTLYKLRSKYQCRVPPSTGV